jgi:hypothetical protein
VIHEKFAFRRLYAETPRGSAAHVRVLDELGAYAISLTIKPRKKGENEARHIIEKRG